MKQLEIPCIYFNSHKKKHLIKLDILESFLKGTQTCSLMTQYDLTRNEVRSTIFEACHAIRTYYKRRGSFVAKTMSNYYHITAIRFDREFWSTQLTEYRLITFHFEDIPEDEKDFLSLLSPQQIKDNYAITN